MNGLFITFEGGDGVGKTTQADLLVEHLRSNGEQVLHTREPGGSDLGLDIREILLHSKGTIDPRAEALLFAADRAQNINTVVRPALASGVHVVQDRYIDSSVAYQGAGRGISPDEVAELSRWATDGLLPDLTVLLDLEPSVARARVTARAGRDRIESADDGFRERLRAGFLAIAAAAPQRFLVLDASEPPHYTAAAIRSIVDMRLLATPAPQA